METIQFIIKTLLSAIIIGSIATLGKRVPTFAAMIASLPLTSILAMIWLFQDTKDVTKIINLSHAIFWMVIPTLLFFLVLPYLLKRSLNFYVAISLSSIFLIISYSVWIKLLKLVKINL